MRARAHADVAGEMDANTARYLGDLAPAASATALSLSETRNALAEAVARETTRLSAEKARLEALLSDVPVGVLLCSATHQLVFYNGQAVDLMGAAAVGAPGLDRDLFDYLREGPIRLAYTRLIETDDPDAASDILCTTVAGAQVLGGADAAFVSEDADQPPRLCADPARCDGRPCRACPARSACWPKCLTACAALPPIWPPCWA